MTTNAQKQAIKKWNDTKGKSDYIKFRIYRELYDNLKLDAKQYNLSVNDLLIEIIDKYDKSLTN